jgi:mannose PTS system EIIA component
MKKYLSETMDESTPGLLLCSHGPLAIGLMQTLEMLAGKNPNMAAFSLEAGDDIDAYRQAIVSQLEAFPEGSIVFVDLFGGTPCNQFFRYIQESEKEVEIITGMNLPMLLNAVLARMNSQGETLSNDSVENGKMGISRIDCKALLSDDDEEDE